MKCGDCEECVKEGLCKPDEVDEAEEVCAGCGKPICLVHLHVIHVSASEARYVCLDCETQEGASP